jgi:hypothetical protein
LEDGLKKLVGRNNIICCSAAVSGCFRPCIVAACCCAGLEDRLKELKGRDNILPKLMSAGSANTDALFDRELKKYDTLKSDVAANVGRNEELLAAISRDAQVRHAGVAFGKGWGRMP